MTTRWLGTISQLHVLSKVKPSAKPGKFDYETPIAFETKLIYTSIDYPDEQSARHGAAQLASQLVINGGFDTTLFGSNFTISGMSQNGAIPVGPNNFRT